MKSLKSIKTLFLLFIVFILVLQFSSIVYAPHGAQGDGGQRSGLVYSFDIILEVSQPDQPTGESAAVRNSEVSDDLTTVREAVDSERESGDSDDDDTSSKRPPRSPTYRGDDRYSKMIEGRLNDARDMEAKAVTARGSSNSDSSIPYAPDGAVVAEAKAAGGWVRWATGGTWTSSFTTLGSTFDRPWSITAACPSCAIGQYLQINTWAEGICSNELVKVESSGGVKGFITSASGASYAHMEAVREKIDACFDEEEYQTNSSGSLRSECNTYYAYRISGEISAGEVPINFGLYLQNTDTGQKCDLYTEFEEDEDYYDCSTGDAALIQIEMERGQLVSLSGINMLYWEMYSDFNEICIHFFNPEEIRSVLGGGRFRSDDETICTPITASEERNYQDFKKEKAIYQNNVPQPRPRGGDNSQMPET